MILGMKAYWAIPVLASILILGSLGLIQEAEAAPGDYIITSGQGKLLRVTPDGTVSTIVDVAQGPRFGVDIDSAGNFISAAVAGKILKVTPDGTVSIIATTSIPIGIAVDSAGDYIVTDICCGLVLKVTPTGTVSTIAAFGQPRDVAIDSAGDYIVADNFFGLRKVTPDGTVSVIVTGFGGLHAVAIDSDGNYIVTNRRSEIHKVTPDGTASFIVGGLPSIARGIAIDSDGNYIVTAHSAGLLLKVTPGGTVSTILSGIGTPWGIVIEPGPQTPEEQAALLIEELEEINKPKADDTIAKLQTALDELAKPDEVAALGAIEGAIGEIEAGIDNGDLGATQGEQLMNDLLDISRQLADDAINLAITLGSDSDKIDTALEKLDEGDDFRGDGEFKGAASKYKDALSEAESALP